MTALIDNLSQEIFQILKGSGRTLSLFDAQGNKVYEPTAARRFFAEPDKLLISIEEDGANSAVKMHLSDIEEIEDLADLIATIRTSSVRFNMMFNVRKYGRALSPKDFAFQSIAEDIILEGMWGSKKTSYQKIGNCKLIVRHNAAVAEEVRGARGRNVHALFVETKDGERFRFPVIHLSGARAMAQHLNQGGMQHDALGEHIVALAEEHARLSAASRFMHHSRNSLSEDCSPVRETIKSRVVEIRRSLSRIARERGYRDFMESFDLVESTIDEAILSEETNRVKTLLGIDENHAMAEVIESVARLTMGKQIMTANTPFRRNVAFAEQFDLDDLVETLTDEFGLIENEGWSRNEGALVVEDEGVFEHISSYLEGRDGYVISENPQDKFQAFATQWVSQRLKDIGEPTVGGEVEKQAAELAQGLKDVVSGRLQIRAIKPVTMRFANPQAEMAAKLVQLLEPSAGIQNDSLWNFLNVISTKMDSDQPLSSNEKFFVARAIALVDSKSAPKESIDMLPEMAEMNTWFEQFDLDNALDESNYDNWKMDLAGSPYGDTSEFEELVELAGSRWNLDEYLASHGSDFEWAKVSDPNQRNLYDTDDLSYETQYVLDSIKHYLAKISVDDEVEVSDSVFDELAADLFKNEVAPVMAGAGYTFTESMQEGTNDKPFPFKVKLGSVVFLMNRIKKNPKTFMTGFNHNIQAIVNAADYAGLLVLDDQGDKTYFQITPAGESFLQGHGNAENADVPFDMSFVNPPIEENLNEGEHGDAIMDLAAEYIAGVGPNDYIGLLSGDDADEAAYDLLNGFKSWAADQISGEIDNRMEELAALYVKTYGYHKESMEEGWDESDRPVYADDVGEEEIWNTLVDEVKDYAKGVSAADLTGDPEDVKALVHDVIGDAVGYALKQISLYYEGGEHWISDLAHNRHDELAAEIRKVLSATAGVEISEDLDESQYARFVPNVMMYVDQILKKFPNEHGETLPQYMERVMDAVKQEVSYNIGMSQAFIQNNHSIRQQIARKLGISLDECGDETLGGDKSDEFIDDVEHENGLNRLRQLAGFSR